MQILFLRGQVPQDRDPKQIMFDNIDDCDDLWTQLAYKLSDNNYGEIWYWNGNRKVVYKDNFIERWIPKFSITKYDFSPDVIFTRGGFKEYDSILNRHSLAFKIYYGAGKRFCPKKMFTDYNLILVDTEKQLQKVRNIFPIIKSDLLIKSAAENIFYPRPKNEKMYDVILVGNYNPRIDKGHDFAFSRIPKKYKIICIGIVPKKIIKKYSHVEFTGWIPRKKIPDFYALSKTSVICCGEIDSCPRVIPEAIACGCPILVLDRVNFNHKKYVTQQTGILTNKNRFSDDVKYMVENYKDFTSYEYYKENLSLKISTQKVLNRIYG